MSTLPHVHQPRLVWRLEVTVEQHHEGGLVRLAAVVVHRGDYVIPKAIEVFHPPVDADVLAQFVQAVVDSIDLAIATTVGIQGVALDLG